MDQLFANIAKITDLLPILLFIFLIVKGKREINRGLWVIFFYCLLVAFNDISDFKLYPEAFIPTALSGFTLIEYFSFTFFLWFNTEKPVFKRILLVFLGLFSLFLIFYYLSVPFDTIDSIPIGVETILVISFSVYFLFEKVNTTQLLLYNTAAFWIIFGFLIYLSGSFFMYLYANQADGEDFNNFWYVTFIFTTFKSIFFAIAFWVHYRQPKIHHPHDYQPFLN